MEHKLEIKLEDYLTIDEIKDIIREEFAASVAKTLSKETELTRIIGNIVHEIVFNEVGKYIPNYKELLTKNVKHEFEKQDESTITNIEIPFGAYDSELQEVSYEIPEGFYAEIKDDRVVIKKVEPTFKVGDWIVNTHNRLIWQITCIRNSLYYLRDVNGNEGYETYDGLRDNYHLRSINDAKDEHETLLRETQVVNAKDDKKDEKIRKGIIRNLQYLMERSEGFVKEDLQERIAWLEKQDEPNPYSGVSFKYNDHIWGMCARDNGVDILLDKQLFKHLEKQGEQPIDKVEPKFNVGDWITNGGYTWKIVEVKPLDYILQSQDGNIVDDTISYVDEQFHSFTIDDAKDGDMLAAHECFVLFKKLDGLNIKCYCTYHYMNNPSFHVDTLHNKDAFHPSTKEQRDTLMKAMANAGYEWDAEKKELKKIEPKFKVGDWIIDEETPNDVFYVIGVLEEIYKVIDIDGQDYHIPHCKADKQFHLWSIDDAKDGDVLETDGSVFIYAKVLYNKPYAYCGVDKYGVFKDNCLENNWSNSVYNIHPATDKQRDQLEKAIMKAGYEWDSEKKELKKIEVASKESDDERIKREIVDCVNAYANLKDEKIPTEWLDWLEGKCKNENRALPDEKRMDSAFTNIKCSPNLNKEESINIQEDYCSYELCKLLKEKGFDEECEWYYPKDGGEREQLLLDELNYDYQRGNFIKCPSHALVMKWLREIYHLRIDVDSGPDWEKDGKIWEYCVCNIYEEPTRILTPKDFPGPSFTTYEEAVEAAIKDILVNLI